MSDQHKANNQSESSSWNKALGPNELAEGRVKTVTIGTISICMTHHNGQYGALDNHCPHQGGPLGEGSIENGYLRCPWHGWDYCPLTGKSPDGYDDGPAVFEVDNRSDGVYVQLPLEPAHVRNISDVMMETMVNWGVKWCFGIVGHSNLFVADALRRQELAKKLTFIGVRHEGAAAFACSAYGKLTGRPASCLGIAGPGATNLITGLWDANVDCAPVLALTGQVATQVLGTGNFQEVDLKSAFGNVAQWAQAVLPNSQHAELMSLACKSSVLNRGVSHLIFPDETAGIEMGDDVAPGESTGRVGDLRISPSPESIDKAVGMLCESKRPVIIVGHGARFHMPEIIALAELLGAPVLTTFKGKGLIPDSHPLGCGVLGRSGTPIASWFMNESDVLLVVGASFSNHTGITPKKPTIQIDFDPMALGKFHAVDVPMLGEISRSVEILAQRLKSDNRTTTDHRPEVAARWKIWREEKHRREKEDRGMGVGSPQLFAAMNRHVPANAIIAVDVGNNTYSFGRYFECDKQSILMSGYLGSIGFSYPAAMGAWAATQEDDPRFSNRPVVSVSGDGGFGQYMAEVTTAVKYGMNITHILLNNCELGKISKEQRAGQWEVWQTSLHNPDFAEYASLCGAMGIRVTQESELDDAIQEALEHDGPSLVEVVTDAELI